ncbi:amidohydrolase family protein [Brumimicrobium oceani]|uniref:Amidohydrolase n=1 Tax=Brumimicrobium oceani TaxID=2100725 RepID=A0A2U2X569_9FLAO|nr:amidohydrolase family protein [Brumimicrobium oceani]PWH82939.1 amidohydrolase [Brumimicrobium oceani]
MKAIKILLTIALTYFIGLSGTAQKTMLLSKGTVHVGNGKVINQGLIGIKGNKIILVDNALTHNLDPTLWDTIIDLKGLDVYPGFFAPNSKLGLTEIDAVRATRDFREVGTYNPHVRSLTAYNAESEIIGTVKTNGVLYTQATPEGGIISGTSSIMSLNAWNWEDAVIKKDDGIHLNWPSTAVGGNWNSSSPTKKSNDNYSSRLKEIRAFFEAALSYSETKDLFDPRFEAMRELFKGEKRLYIHADEMRALLDIIDFQRELEIKFPVIIGGYDAYKVADQLNAYNIPVMIKGGHTLPSNEDDPIDLPYRLPYLLKEAGVLFCIQNSGRMETMNTRNIPFLAGTAMAYGLTEEEAISAISLNTAKILGIEKLAGSIEEGKLATLFVNKGTPLDMRSNNLILGMVNGAFIDLTNVQTKLYDKYKSKYENEK